MQRILSRALAGALTVALAGVVLAPTAARAADDDTPKRKRGTFQAQRAGWMLGMYIGEQKGFPYPFVLQLDDTSDAKAKGIRVGDELMRLNDEEVRSLPNTFEKALKLRPGREVKVWMRRGSQTLPFEIVVPTHPGSADAGKEKTKNGEKTAAEGEEGDGKKPKKAKKKGGSVIIKPIPADNP
jgi:C-terminal processing protease CtpA/Prc